MKPVKKVFVTGIFVLIPIMVTISIISWLFLKVDKIFRAPIQSITGRSFFGLGIILTLAIIVLTGFLATNYLGKKIIDFAEKTIAKVPIVNSIYGSTRQLRDSFIMNQKRKTFKSVVLVEYPSPGIYTIGFITANAPDIVEDVAEEKMKSIFIPTTPNPTSGMFVMMPYRNVRNLDISIDAAIKLVVSAGILSDSIEADGGILKDDKNKETRRDDDE